MSKDDVREIRRMLKLYGPLYFKGEIYDQSGLNLCLDNIQSNLDDRLCLGFDEKSMMPVIFDPLRESSSGVAFFGNNTSGSKNAFIFSIVTRIITNPETDLFVILDSQSCDLFPLAANVASGFSKSAICSSIKMIHDELKRREFEFYQLGAYNLITYEEEKRKTNKEYRLSRIFLCLDLDRCDVLNTRNRFMSKVPGTLEYRVFDKLVELIRFGSRCGIVVILHSSKPLLLDFCFPLVFGVHDLESFSQFGLNHAAKIKYEDRGRCAYSGGFMQFPYIFGFGVRGLIQRAHKPIKAELMVHSVPDYISKM